MYNSCPQTTDLTTMMLQVNHETSMTDPVRLTVISMTNNLRAHSANESNYTPQSSSVLLSLDSRAVGQIEM